MSDSCHKLYGEDFSGNLPQNLNGLPEVSSFAAIQLLSAIFKAKLWSSRASFYPICSVLEGGHITPNQVCEIAAKINALLEIWSIFAKKKLNLLFY